VSDSPTIGALVEKHNELLAYVEAEQAAFDERIKPYTDALATIKGAALAHLQEQGQQNAKTEFGTAYQSTIMSVKVDNPAIFLDFIREQGLWTMLQVGALKEPVREFLDTTSRPPPGLKVDFITKCNIRRS
jgi:hypothetical protein